MADSLRGLSTSRGVAVVATCAVFWLLSTAAALVRAWALSISNRTIQYHDYFMFVALFCSWGSTITLILCCYPGVGGMYMADVEKVDISVISMTYQVVYAAGWFWVSGSTMAKLSILHLYLGIFIHRTFMILAYAIAASTCLFWVVYIGLQLAVCRPIEAYWNFTIDGECNDLLVQNAAMAIINMAIDLAIVALPLYSLWRLQMPTTKKLTISVFLSLGIVICVLMAIRAWEDFANDGPELYYLGAFILLLSDLEVKIAIITGSLPTIGPLIFKKKKMVRSASVQSLRHSASKSPTVYARETPSAHSFANQHEFEASTEDGIALGTMGKHAQGKHAQGKHHGSDASSMIHINTHNDTTGVRHDWEVP